MRWVTCSPSTLLRHNDVPPIQLPREAAADRHLDITHRYAAAARQAAAEERAACVDLFTGMLQREQWRGLLCDGLHLSGAGQQVLWEEVKKALEAHFPNLKYGMAP